LRKRKNKDKDPQNVQGNAVGHRLKKWAASAVGMKADAFVKNEARIDEGAGVGEEGNGDEHEVGERADGEKFKVPPLRCAPEDEHSDVEEHKRDDEFAGDHAPNLRVERFAKRAEHGERREREHGQTESGKKGDFFAKRHGPQSDEKDENAEGDAVRVMRKKVWRPEQENGHGGHVQDGGKGQSQVKRTKRQSGSAPQRAVVIVPD
jgi:hypothetical protein